ncbi:hypothetical protein Scep_001346 [Stephania cephalantha]|uniref:Uncharacterized protein n=1 Tax=Stephania cephalantha TaxID=152367 RepID=A0AAP0LAK4_9MAGN
MPETPAVAVFAMPLDLILNVEGERENQEGDVAQAGEMAVLAMTEIPKFLSDERNGGNTEHPQGSIFFRDDMINERGKIPQWEYGESSVQPHLIVIDEPHYQNDRNGPVEKCRALSDTEEYDKQRPEEVEKAQAQMASSMNAMAQHNNLSNSDPTFSNKAIKAASKYDAKSIEAGGDDRLIRDTPIHNHDQPKAGVWTVNLFDSNLCNVVIVVAQAYDESISGVPPTMWNDGDTNSNEPEVLRTGEIMGQRSREVAFIRSNGRAVIENGGVEGDNDSVSGETTVELRGNSSEDEGDAMPEGDWGSLRSSFSVSTSVASSDRQVPAFDDDEGLVEVVENTLRVTLDLQQSVQALVGDNPQEQHD